MEDLLSLGGFESRIDEKGASNHPLSDAAKEGNSIKSGIRAYVAHVFSCAKTSRGGRLTKEIGLVKNETWWASKISHLVFCAICSVPNMVRRLNEHDLT